MSQNERRINGAIIDAYKRREEERRSSYQREGTTDSRENTKLNSSAAININPDKNNNEYTLLPTLVEPRKDFRSQSVLEVPYHQTRRHFKNVGSVRHANVWQYDPIPDEKAAGMTSKSPAYNIINGARSVQGDLTSLAPQLRRLPDFLKNKYQYSYPSVPHGNNPYMNSRYQDRKEYSQNRMNGYRSKIFY